jgi:cytochrome c-type biogenesis protein CcmH/NrfG
MRGRLRCTLEGFFVPATPSRGLPLRIYLPIVVVIAALFLGIMGYLVSVGFGVSGSVFGKAGETNNRALGQGTQNAVEGGPPAAVVEQLKGLRERIATHPNDDVAITQLADMELAANRFHEAIPLYERALKVNPGNVAAQTGLAEAREALRTTGTQ